MKKLLLLALLFTCMVTTHAATIGTWKAFMAYHDIKEVADAGNNKIFVLATNSLYLYNKNDGSIQTYDYENGMNDVKVLHIAWNKTAQRLLVIYTNSNIDLMDIKGNTTNVPDIYNKSMSGSKTVNAITISSQYAYLATDFGIVKLDMSNSAISDTYFMNTVYKVAIQGSNIYAKALLSDGATVGVKVGNTSNNLLDSNNWHVSSDYTVSSSIFDEDKTDYNNNIALLNTLNPGGPKKDTFYYTKFKNGTLYTVGGQFSYASSVYNVDGCVQSYKDGNWTIFEDSLNKKTGFEYKDITCVDVYGDRVIASGRTGMYEFDTQGKYVTYYNQSNTTVLKGAYSDKATNNQSSQDYTLVLGIAFDKSGNLWALNSQALNTGLLCFATDGSQTDYSTSTIKTSTGISLYYMTHPFFDSRELLWWGNEFDANPDILCYQPSSNTLLRYKIDDEEVNRITCSAEDQDGNIIIGTNAGPYFISNSYVGQSSVTFSQPIIPRNDGTNLGDYLLDGTYITSIAVDGAGRKWFGTNSQGVYLISKDNMTQIHHFTKENSGLISNVINSISVNSTTGEVYIATQDGLCSYMGDATDAATTMDNSSVYAYPNPVKPDFTGNITIVGLTLDADVKITTATGYLVKEGRSNGGTFIWDGTDRYGKKVVSGIYDVITATSDGNKGTVCKVAIVR
jgi:hypothetical protein